MKQILSGLFWGGTGAVLVFVLSPLVIVIVSSFSGAMDMAFPPARLSMDWYRRAWEHLIGFPGATPPRLGQSVLASGTLALSTAFASGIFGTLAACSFRSLAPRGRAFLENVYLAPLLVPTVVSGIGLLVLFSNIGIHAAMVRLLLGHLVVTTPYVFMTVSASLRMRGPALEEAALTLGATPFKTFIFITLPLLKDAILGGMAFAFLLSFHHFTVTYFLYAGDWKPLPMWIFEYLGYQLDPLIAVINTGVIVITVVVTVCVNRLIGITRMSRIG